MSWCKKCKEACDLAKRRERPEHEAARRRKTHLARTYGLTLEEYDIMSRDGCNICGVKTESDGRRLAVDHCHDTGEVRGVLCRRCNKTLGQFEDSVLLLHNAITYLQRTVSE